MLKHKKKWLCKSIVALLTILSIFNATALASEKVIPETNELQEISADELAALDNSKAAYGARISQGNTDDELDALAFHNGLTDAGYYSDASIYEQGWRYNSYYDSDMLQNRATASGFRNSRLYEVAYWTGHGSKSGGVPTLNPNCSAAAGTYTPFNVATTLDVDGSNWMNDSDWQESDDIRVLVLGACNQLDISVMKYYARAMRASSIRAIAGYHMTSPTDPVDTSITEDYFDYASAGNSVKYSWQHANEDNSAASKWAVLVYKENYNQYYRMPGFPGNTYPTPSSTATIYRYRNGVSSGEVVSTSKQSEIDLTNLPLYISAIPDTSKTKISINEREATDTKENFTDDRSATDKLMQSFLGDDKFNTLYCIKSPVICDEVNPESGQVKNSEVIVEWSYKYFNTYNNVRISDAFISFTVDSEGIYHTTNKWKTVNISESNANKKITNLIDKKTAFDYIDKAKYENYMVESSGLIYAPVGKDMYKLNYEFVSNDGTVLWIDASTGDVVQR